MAGDGEAERIIAVTKLEELGLIEKGEEEKRLVMGLESSYVR